MGENRRLSILVSEAIRGNSTPAEKLTKKSLHSFCGRGNSGMIAVRIDSRISAEISAGEVGFISTFDCVNAFCSANNGGVSAL